MSGRRPARPSRPDGSARPAPAPRWALPLLLAGVVVQLVVLYAPSTPSTGGLPHVDKVVHVAVFAVVAFAARACRRRWSGALLVGSVLAGHAAASELVQHLLLPGRSGDPWDVVADVAGVGLGLLAARALPAAAARDLATWGRGPLGRGAPGPPPPRGR